LLFKYECQILFGHSPYPPLEAGKKRATLPFLREKSMEYRVKVLLLDFSESNNECENRLFKQQM
jgi:hypothetical protein